MALSKRFLHYAGAETKKHTPLDCPWAANPNEMHTASRERAGCTLYVRYLRTTTYVGGIRQIGDQSGGTWRKVLKLLWLIF